MKALFQLPDKDELLTSEEIADMTESKIRAGQIKWLDENGYVYEIHADGWPRVHRYYRMCRMMGVNPSEFIHGAKKWELDINSIS